MMRVVGMVAALCLLVSGCVGSYPSNEHVQRSMSVEVRLDCQQQVQAEIRIGYADAHDVALFSTQFAHDNDVWSPTLTVEGTWGGVRGWTAKAGPKWFAGDAVEVVVEARFDSNQLYKLTQRTLVQPVELNAIGCAPNLAAPPTDWQHGSNSNYPATDAPMIRVVQDQGAWKELWALHAPSYSKDGFYYQSAPPAIDFTQEVVVAAFAGVKPSWGYDIDVTAQDSQDGGPLRLDVREIWPGAAPVQCTEVCCVTFGDTATPYRFITVQRGGFDPHLAPALNRSVFVSACGQEGEGLWPLDGGRGSGVNVSKPTAFVLATATEFAKFWQQHQPGSPPPFVDFPRHVVVAAVAPNGSYSQSIDLRIGPYDGSRALAANLEVTTYECGRADEQDLGRPFAILMAPSSAFNPDSSPTVAVESKRFGCGGVDLTCHGAMGTAPQAFLRVFPSDDQTPATNRTVRELVWANQTWELRDTQLTDARGCAAFTYAGPFAQYAFDASFTSIPDVSQCVSSFSGPVFWDGTQDIDLTITDGPSQCGT